MKILALDVGGTSIKSAYVVDSIILESHEIPSEGNIGGEYVLKNIIKTIDLYNDNYYEAIGISATGQVSSNEGCIIYDKGNIPNYSGIRFKDIITQKYNKPVYMENDVNAAAIGEKYYGAAKQEKDFICLTYGTGVGGAIVINNELYRGLRGVAGEIGHIITHSEGLPCACGLNGCYERYASTNALIKKAQVINPCLKSGKEIFELLNEGNVEIKKVIDSWIDEIIYGLVSLVHIFNPACILLGGGIMDQQYITEQINVKIKERVMSSFTPVRVIAAQLGNNAGIYGMVAIAEKASANKL